MMLLKVAVNFDDADIMMSLIMMVVCYDDAELMVSDIDSK